MLTHARLRSSASKRPKDTAFRQQRLPAWQPIMTIHSSLFLFFTIGIFFVPIGIICLVSSNKALSLSVDYTDCVNIENLPCSSLIMDTGRRAACECELTLEVNQDFTGNVYFYYGLERFWQNLRRYVDSRDDNQLIGKLNGVSDNTKPFRNPPNQTGIFYAPAGAIANSMFNDKFVLTRLDGNIVVPWFNTGIAWETDIAYKFNNPPTFNNTAKPPNWPVPVDQLDPTRPSNNGYQNEDLIVWMRTAALPHFKKLYRILDRSGTGDRRNGIFTNSLPAGQYNLTVTYQYPVTGFKGRKYFIISTTTWLGTKNPFLGYAYICVGSVSILTGLVFLALHVNFRDRSSQTRRSELFDC